MALKCDICGKGRTIGKSGAHKYGGKWAMRAVKAKKVWKPNLQSYTVSGQKMRLCTRCIKRVKFDLRKVIDKTKKPVTVKPVVKEEKPKEKRVARKTSKKTPSNE